MKQVAAYRKIVNMTQSQMAEVAGIAREGYNLREKERTSWRSTEMQKILIELRKTFPELTYDIFFEDAVLI